MSGTADIYTTVPLHPSKIELLRPWLAEQSWFTDDPATAERVAFFRFVDPDGEVGLDSMLIAAGDNVYYVPVTYRSEPLAEGTLIGMLEHGALGTRYCYDAPTDPVFAIELARVIRESDSGSDMLNIETQEMIDGGITVQGTGVSVVSNTAGQLRLVRLLDGQPDTQAARGFLIGTWTHEGVDREDILAVLR